MNGKITIAFLALLIGATLYAKPTENDYLQKVNMELPHKFKELRTGATLEVVREQHVVKIYMLVDDIEQYDEILVERSDELQKNFAQCKVIQIVKGKYKNNYVEVVDQYPLPPKMTNTYRIKTVTADGITRMYAPVAITTPEDIKP